MYIKKPNARVTFRSNRRPNFKRNNNFSNNKSKNKGNTTQQYNKYLKLATEASSTGDRIQSEYYYQFTDHYYRVMTELGINIEENDNDENHEDNSNLLEEKKVSDNNENIDEIVEKDVISESNDDIESIEAIPFISKPPKKKSARVKKKST